MDKQGNSQSNQEEQQLVHELTPMETMPLFNSRTIIIFSFIVLLGIGSGYVLSSQMKKSSTVSMNAVQNASSIPKGTVVGSDDTKTFKDQAEGELRAGGIEDEGQFHLVRPGGDSQNVYLTSSIVDLSKFIGKKIRVWGQTNKAKKAGWLMDVGRVETLE